MKTFNLTRLNKKLIELGERPLSLKTNVYRDLIIKDDYLVNEKGEHIGTKGDMYTKLIMDKILQDGTLDYNPRPHYEDKYENAKYYKSDRLVVTSDEKEIYLGKNDIVKEREKLIKVWVPAHTLSLNDNIMCSYDLSKGESPMITLRPIAINTSIAEILWIYGKESNDLVLFDELLGKRTWEKDGKINNWWKDWAIKDSRGNYILNEVGHPTIGACYGETVKRRHMLKKEVIDAIKSNPDGRRHITNLWQIDDFSELHGLKPCAFLTDWNVRHDWDGKDYLDMSMTQRSSDFATAGCINQVQYAALLKMVANELNLEAGVFTWKPSNIQLYDRHIANAIEMLNREPVNCKATIECNNKKWEEFTPDDVYLFNYPKEEIKIKNKQLKFQLGI